jgi:hypothetical protein
LIELERGELEEPLDAMVTPITPFPVPEEGISATHESESCADHEQLDPLAVIWIEPDPPFAGQEESGAPSDTVQFAPLWVAVNVWPAIVAVNVCVALLLFGGMVRVTVLLSTPELGVAPSPEAVQEHEEVEVVTFTNADPPAAGTRTLAGLMP